MECESHPPAPSRGGHSRTQERESVIKNSFHMRNYFLGLQLGKIESTIESRQDSGFIKGELSGEENNLSLLAAAKGGLRAKHSTRGGSLQGGQSPL